MHYLFYIQNANCKKSIYITFAIKEIFKEKFSIKVLSIFQIYELYFLIKILLSHLFFCLLFVICGIKTNYTF